MPISRYHPWLLHCCIFAHRFRRHLVWRFDGRRYCRTRRAEPLAHRVKKHQSVLIRKYQSELPSDAVLHMQYNKITNLKVVVRQLDGLLIRPGETFSFCRLVGKPSLKRGFVEGMELSRGQARPGVGGGICQSSNLIYWLVLHSPLEVIERHHHSFDPFPDQGRVLPFASGATVMYNYRDLRFCNPTDKTFQLRLWLDHKCLIGELRCDQYPDLHYKVIEKNHYFEQRGELYFRSNELWRQVKPKAVPKAPIAEEFIVRNYAEVKYRPAAVLLRPVPGE